MITRSSRPFCNLSGVSVLRFIAVCPVPPTRHYGRCVLVHSNYFTKTEGSCDNIPLNQSNWHKIVKHIKSSAQRASSCLRLLTVFYTVGKNVDCEANIRGHYLTLVQCVGIYLSASIEILVCLYFSLSNTILLEAPSWIFLNYASFFVKFFHPTMSSIQDRRLWCLRKMSNH